MWRKTTPKGMKIRKFIEGPDGKLVRDSSYVGEDAWDDDSELPQDNVRQIVESDASLNAGKKKRLEEELGISGLYGPAWKCVNLLLHIRLHFLAAKFHFF